ncbi:hypothetical protein M569_11075, partial [Genlisea aurea]
HTFWPQTYCRNHYFNRDSSICCSCTKLEGKNESFVPLDEGRVLCLECLDSAIMDTLQCQPLYIDVQEFYEAMNMKLSQQVPLLIVDRKALNEAKIHGRIGGDEGETRGLTMTEIAEVQTIMERPRGDGSIRRVPIKLTQQAEITAILVIYGLPRLHTGAILAHELMHAWLHLNGYLSLRPEIEEGMCQVMGRIWLEAEIARLSDGSSSGGSPFEKKLGVFFLFQMAASPDPIYGGGFRRCNDAVMRHGLRKTLDVLGRTNDLP